MRTVKKVKIGENVVLGDGKIYIQSMLNCPLNDIQRNIEQAAALERAGCDIIRVAVLDDDSMKLINALKKNIRIPLVADIHFDYKLAIKAVLSGVDKIRINPSNIGEADKIKEVARVCRKHGVPIRVGVNYGSIQRDIKDRYATNPALAMVESALDGINILNMADFEDIVVSVKSSNVKTVIEGYEMLAKRCPYPLHLGVTEAGDEAMGRIKSAVGIGALLAKGIGETIRVSLTGDPIKEVAAANDILRALELKKNEINYVSCPTCGRTKIDIISLLSRIKSELKEVKKPIKVAVMGCAVNGPGEAKDADIGIAGGDGCAVLFKGGEVVRKVEERDIVKVLVDEIQKM